MCTATQKHSKMVGKTSTLKRVKPGARLPPLETFKAKPDKQLPGADLALSKELDPLYFLCQPARLKAREAQRE